MWKRIFRANYSIIFEFGFEIPFIWIYSYLQNAVNLYKLIWNVTSSCSCWDNGRMLKKKNKDGNAFFFCIWLSQASKLIKKSLSSSISLGLLWGLAWKFIDGLEKIAEWFLNMKDCGYTTSSKFLIHNPFFLILFLFPNL